MSNTLSGVHSFTSDILVGYKTELIITGTVKMDAGTKILVERGARLVINGGTVTTNDPNEELWLGIEVHGHSHYTNHPAGWGQAFTGQYGGMNSTIGNEAGVVILKNNALLERAVKGVWAGSSWLGKEAGIIISLNSTIQYCQDGIVFDKYLTKKNASCFRNTTFRSGALLVADWIDPNDKSLGYNTSTSDFYANSFITMNQVIDIPILGCTFLLNGTITNLGCNGPYNGMPCFKPEDGHCIIANDATFLVDAYYGGLLGQTVLYPSHFNHAKQAIVVKDLCLNSYRPIIRNSSFNGCFESIVVKGSNNIQIHHNNFSMWHDEISGDERPIGIYLEGSTGYNVENNYIDGEVPNSGPKTSKAILVTNSGANGDLIYKNTFIDVVHGGHSQNDNRGLEFDCNVNDYNFGTGLPLPEPYVNFVATEDGIANSGLANQGSPSRPVHNTFEHYCTGNFSGFSFGDFFIDNSIPTIQYNYPQGSVGENPDCHNINENPVLWTTTEDSLCPDKLLPGGTRTYDVADELTPLRITYMTVQGPQTPPYTDDEINDAKHMFVRAMNEYIGTFLDGGDATGAVAYLLTEDFDFARRKLIPLQIHTGDFSGATATMNLLDVNEIENEMFKDYYTIVSEVYSTDTLFDSLENSQLTTLELIANSQTRVSTQAQNWLEMFFGEAYSLIKHPVLVPLNNNERRESTNNSKLNLNQHTQGVVDGKLVNLLTGNESPITFYPNPSRDLIHFDTNEVGVVMVKDLNGRLILSEKVTNGLLNIKGIRSGVYYIEYNEQAPQRLLISN